MNFTEIGQWVAILAIATENLALSIIAMHHTKKISLILDAIKMTITKDEEEDRCNECKKKESCPAYDTGVIKPCPHYEEG